MVRAEPTTSATNAALTGDFGLSLDGRLVPLGFDGNGHIVPGLQLQSGLDTTATGTYAVGANHSFTATVTITDAAGKATTWALNGTVNRAGDVAAISATPAAGGATMLGMMAKSDPPFVVWTGGGSLGVRGTIGNDIVVVSEKNGVISISQNGQTEVFSGNVNYLEVRTGEGNDKVLVVGKVASMIVDGGPGNDTLMGGERRDSLYGGAGKDYLDGGGDKDLLKGGAGPDVILTGGSFTDPFAVSDRAYGGGGNDTITGGAGRDNLYGEGGNDRIAGGDGSDLLDGGANNDTLDAGKGADTLAGGGGNDRLFGGEGFGLFLGGAGDDIIVSRDNAAESVVGGTGDDSVLGDASDVLSGIEVVLP